jgi:hypothetical protein
MALPASWWSVQSSHWLLFIQLNFPQNIVPTIFIVRIGLFPPPESESGNFNKFLV